MYVYVKGKMGMTASGSFTKDQSKWMKFTQTEVNGYRSVNAKPYGATKRGEFIHVDKYM
jgi:hypothetical protein